MNVARLDAFASEGDWQRALTVVGGALAEAPSNDRLHFQVAALHLYLEDLESYRKVRDAAMAMDETAPSIIPARVATTGLLLADPDVDLPRLVALAERPLPQWAKEQGFAKWAQVSRALAAYRTGRFEDAVELALAERGEEFLGKVYEAQMLLIEAMAKAKLGNGAGAREAFRKGKLVVDQKFGAPHTKLRGNWHNWLTAAILLREAKAIVGGMKGEK